MWRVIGRLGGQRITIPVRLANQNLLVRELGWADANAVWQAWRGRYGAGGEISVTVPRLTVARRLARARYILGLVETEKAPSVREIARTLSLHERTIYDDLKLAREDRTRLAAGGKAPVTTPPQLDLFSR